MSGLPDQLCVTSRSDIINWATILYQCKSLPVKPKKAFIATSVVPGPNTGTAAQCMMRQFIPIWRIQKHGRYK